MTEDDGVDNDCDGLIDEELCDERRDAVGKSTTIVELKTQGRMQCVYISLI